MGAAAAAESPVSISTRRPAWRSAVTASAASGRSASRASKYATGVPSSAIHRRVTPGSGGATSSGSGMKNSRKSASLPSRQSCPSTRAVKPRPGNLHFFRGLPLIQAPWKNPPPRAPEDGSIAPRPPPRCAAVRARLLPRSRASLLPHPVRARLNFLQHRPAHGQRSRLVEHNHIQRRQPGNARAPRRL